MLLSGTFTVSQTQSSWYCWTAFKHNACMYGSSFPDTTCVTQHILFQPPPSPSKCLELLIHVSYDHYSSVLVPDLRVAWRGLGIIYSSHSQISIWFVDWVQHSFPLNPQYDLCIHFRPILQLRTWSTIILKCPHTCTHTHTPHTHTYITHPHIRMHTTQGLTIYNYHITTH